MKKILILLTLIFLFWGCSKEKVDFNQNKIEYHILTNNTDPVNGLSFIWYADEKAIVISTNNYIPWGHGFPTTTRPFTAVLAVFTNIPAGKEITLTIKVNKKIVATKTEISSGASYMELQHTFW